MPTMKEDVQRILDRLPEDASLDDIEYEIYVLRKIRRGIDDAEAGRVVPQSEAESRLSKWTAP